MNYEHDFRALPGEDERTFEIVQPESADGPLMHVATLYDVEDGDEFVTWFVEALNASLRARKLRPLIGKLDEAMDRERRLRRRDDGSDQ